MPGQLEPYRAERRFVARVPATPDALVRHFVESARAGAVASAASLFAIVLVTGSRAQLAHANNVWAPSALPPLPAACAPTPPLIRFAALGPLHLVDAGRIAERYRNAGVANVRLEAPLPFEVRFHDSERDQLIGEEIVDAARLRFGAVPQHELVIVLTERDMYLHTAPWRFAFATTAKGIVVVSVARMDPSSLRLIPYGLASLVPRAPPCTAVLHARVQDAHADHRHRPTPPRGNS